MTGLFFCYYRFVTFTAAFPLPYDGKAAIIFVEVANSFLVKGKSHAKKTERNIIQHTFPNLDAGMDSFAPLAVADSVELYH